MPASPAPASPEDLASRWHSLAIHLLRSMRREDAKAGLTGPRLSALSVIVFGGPITLTDLAAAEQVRPPTMSRLVDALVAEGLVRRERDEVDRRSVRLRPTRKGESLLMAGRDRRVARIAGPIASLTDAERRTLDRAARLMTRVVGALSGPPVSRP